MRNKASDLEEARDEAARLLLEYARAVVRVRDLEKAQSAAPGVPFAPIDPEEREVYSPRTLAERWLCSERHVRNLIAQGAVKSFTIGKHAQRIKLVDVIAFEKQAKR